MAAFVALVQQSVKEWTQDMAPRLAAALAYYTTFSIAPFLVVVISVAGLVYGRSTVRGEILAQIEQIMGSEGRTFIEGMITTAGQGNTGILGTIIGTAILLFGALGMFAELQNALNMIWNVKLKPAVGFSAAARQIFFSRLISFSMLLVAGFLLLVSMVLTAILARAQEYLTEMMPGLATLLQAANIVVFFLVGTALFAMIYKFLPDARVAWKDVLVGGAVTSFLFSIGRYLLGLYFGLTTSRTVFGTAGSLALLLLWIYYSSQILFFGAEFTQVYARFKGRPIEPDKNAIPLTQVEKARQGRLPKESGPIYVAAGPTTGPDRLPGSVARCHPKHYRKQMKTAE